MGSPMGTSDLQGSKPTCRAMWLSTFSQTINLGLTLKSFVHIPWAPGCAFKSFWPQLSDMTSALSPKGEKQVESGKRLLQENLRKLLPQVLTFRVP